MALVKGVNCGFLLAGGSPSADPGGAEESEISALIRLTKDTAPAGATKVTEIGWWCSGISEEANFEVGLYDDVAAEPENLLAGASQTNAKGTTAGWKKVTGLNIAITAGTTYWAAAQVDNTATTTNMDRDATTGTENGAAKAATTLVNPIVSPTVFESVYAIYAVTDATPPAGGQDGPYVY